MGCGWIFPIGPGLIGSQIFKAWPYGRGWIPGQARNDKIESPGYGQESMVRVNEGKIVIK
ncbi:MAG: hypothetical protein UX08_C0008G0001 [Candidatus Collierbacteria bacterium GW2011_GWB1_45_35]|uniref:Uncharacterized protein n=1 Tax=Candidatus Collierbacteria bacterium GW2011_GWB2_45_17 TaxID=1618388 RepID=A0A837IG86_9BACT|nr:MAG: hypothetical protein UW48_C0011G0001 [Microgenomates group bacterium GW2011_GWC1_44_23]KKT95071.1 MAG: hypothetical protein UW96_C0011G0017 [Candidatus Collierbacteria bacterium GW2011_GWA1_45_15]KKT99155.1 MAG: hypothetical protein UX01_C0012G0001 [Candidatus Collierbacteria bacterium GW2011_GWB2_45_17]KKU05274.1 MAG: hypothetical protein UX08_C0008G0001 [Candidatus Collierbacteria bacterium GW2011_GWB1_45_35]KKU07694.1 MAG: hypothetical protein UX11_C0011G0001 [Candidatus Collierbacte